MPRPPTQDPSVNEAMLGTSGPAAAERLTASIASATVVVFTQPNCQYCARVEALLRELGVVAPTAVSVAVPTGSAARAALAAKAGATSVPQVFVGGRLLGGHDDMRTAAEAGTLGATLSSVGVIMDVEAAGAEARRVVAAWPTKVDWAERPFCEAFIHGGNVPNSHAGGSATFLGGLGGGAVVYLAAACFSPLHSFFRWLVVVPLLFGGFSGLQGVTNT